MDKHLLGTVSLSRRRWRDQEGQRQTESESRQLEAAKLTYEHVLFLWNDQVGYANTLQERKKFGAGLLILLIGVGAFRLQLTRSPDDISSLSPMGMASVVWCLRVALVLSVCGAYWIYVDRPLFRRLLTQISSDAKRHAGYLFSKARARSSTESDGIRLPIRPPNRWDRHRATLTMLPVNEEIDSWFRMAPADVWKIRTERLRQSYRAMCFQNKALSLRVRVGTLLLGLAVCSTFGAFSAYICTIDW